MGTACRTIDGEADLLLGGLYLSLGLHNEAGRALRDAADARRARRRAQPRLVLSRARSGTRAAISTAPSDALAQVAARCRADLEAERMHLLANCADAPGALSTKRSRCSTAGTGAASSRLDGLRALQPGRGAGAQGAWSPRRTRSSTRSARWNRGRRRAAGAAGQGQPRARLRLSAERTSRRRRSPCCERVRLDGPQSEQGAARRGLGAMRRRTSSRRR